jgi:DNA-binding response OmpR family regulator
LFDLRRLFLGWRAGSSDSGEVQEEPQKEIRLLAITADIENEIELRRIAADPGWQIVSARSSEEAVAALESQEYALVICDRDLPGEDWREVLSRLTSLAQRTCILLASPVADEYLWNEVIQHRGYDVVTKPYRYDELRRAITFAGSWAGRPESHRREAASR